MWYIKELFHHPANKNATITAVCKDKHYYLETSPENFLQSPASLEKYNRFIELIDSGDEDLSWEAEEELYDWAFGPFLPMFNQPEAAPAESDQPRPLTLQKYLSPEIYHYILYVVDEKLEPRLYHKVTNKPIRPNGVDLKDLDSFTPHENWEVFRPADIEICASDHDSGLAGSCSKVLAGGKTCFYKPLEYGGEEPAIREMRIYKRIEEMRGLSNDTLRVPRFYGIVQEEMSTCVLGLLISWIDYEDALSKSAKTPETPTTLQRKWDMQVEEIVDRLHRAGIFLEDARESHTVIDANDDAWVAGFGGRYTRARIEKSGTGEGHWKISMARIRD